MASTPVTFSPNLGGAGDINVTADSALGGKINNDTTNHAGLKPINIGNVGGTVGDLGAHTLNLDAVTAAIYSLTWAQAGS